MFQPGRKVPLVERWNKKFSVPFQRGTFWNKIFGTSKQLGNIRLPGLLFQLFQ
jgi:hypothetical protein